MEKARKESTKKKASFLEIDLEKVELVKTYLSEEKDNLWFEKRKLALALKPAD